MDEAAAAPLEEAHRIGTFEADQLDEALRALERRDREVIAAAAVAAAASSPCPAPAPVPTVDREELRRLREFETNVAGSRAWRIVQALRRLFGRAW